MATGRRKSSPACAAGCRAISLACSGGNFLRHDNSYRALWRIPHLPGLLASMAMTRLAARMFSLTLVLFVLARYASPTLAGWLIFAAVTPGLFLSPICGAVLDRV